MLNVASNWIILKSWHNNMYGTKWSNLIYILVFWLQITVRTVTCIVYEPVSRNIKQIYEHSNICKIKRQNHFKGFFESQNGIFIVVLVSPIFWLSSFFLIISKPVEEEKYFEITCFDIRKSYGVGVKVLSISTANGFCKVIWKKKWSMHTSRKIFVSCQGS